MMIGVVSSSVLLLLACSRASADSSDHKYKAGEHVELWVNKVCDV
jgi:hypothetical protein